MTTKAQALENLGYNKFDLLRDGYNGFDTEQLLRENMIQKCEACKSWEDIETSGGNGEACLCPDCYENSNHILAKEAREIYKKLDAE